jgi:hypothetical protein
MPQVQPGQDFQTDDDPEDIDDFMQRRQSEQAAQTPDAWAAANQAYGQAIRAGQDVDLQQPGDVLAYGADLTSGNGASPPPSGNVDPADCAQPVHWTGLPEPILQADTAIRAAANALTFGKADNAAAAMDALIGPGGLDRWNQRYQANLEEEQARNQYDAVHRPVAQAIGSVGGGLLGVLATGPMEGAVAAAPRLAGAAQLTAREGAAMIGAGGAAGLGTQAWSDLDTGHLSTPGDYAGAAIGGIAGAGAGLLRLGPARAGAVDGAVTSAAQDILNGRPISTQQAAQSALIGNLLGGVAGIAGRAWSDGLSTSEKGSLGETLGGVRAKVNGEQRISGPKQRASVNGLDKDLTNQKGSYWYPDGVDGDVAYEDKFGTGARLSPNQTLAQQNMGQNFRLNSFLPADIGRMTGLLAAPFAPQAVKQNQDR